MNYQLENVVFVGMGLVRFDNYTMAQLALCILICLSEI